MNNKRSVPVGDELLGRLLDAYGNPIDGGAPLEGLVTRAVATTPPAKATRAGAMLETGIKAIDFYAPLTRGGVAVLEGRPGSGLIVIASELAHNLRTQHGGRTVMAVLDAAGRPARELSADLRGSGIEDATVVVTAVESDSTSRAEAVRTVLAIAEHFAEQGHETLLVVEEQLIDGRTAGRLRSGSGENLTTLVWRTLDGEPAAPRIADPDAVVVLRPELGRRNIWPAVEPLVSRSRLLDSGVGRAHRQAVERIRELLRETDSLGPSGASGAGAGRARRALLFQTQPFAVAELYTARPGVYTDLSSTVDIFAAIADGAYDDVPEPALSFVGTAPRSAKFDPHAHKGRFDRTRHSAAGVRFRCARELSPSGPIGGWSFLARSTPAARHEELAAPHSN